MLHLKNGGFKHIQIRSQGMVKGSGRGVCKQSTKNKLNKDQNHKA